MHHDNNDDAKRTKVTPEMAEAFLSNLHEDQRPLYAPWAEELSRRNLEDDWHVGNDAVCLTSDGKLLNGQHRLTAIVLSAKPAYLLIRRNVDPRDYDGMDDVYRRTIGYMLSREGHQNGTTLAAAARRLIGYKKSGNLGSVSVAYFTPRDARLFIAANPDIIPSVAQAYGVYELLRPKKRNGDVSEKAKSPLTPTQISTAAFLFRRIDAEAAERFWDHVAGRTLPNTPRHPCLLLREELFRHRAKGKLDEKVKSAYVVKAWNAFLEGGDDAEMTFLRWSPNKGGKNQKTVAGKKSPQEPFPLISGCQFAKTVDG